MKHQFYSNYPLVFPTGAPEGGLYCGRGWFELLDCLFQVINEELGKLDPEQRLFRITYLKEKWGRLVIGFDHATEYIKQTIHQAEEMSEHICETCGEYGHLRDSAHWVKVRCDACEAQHFVTRQPLSPEAQAALEAGLKSAHEGPPVYCGSFAKYADDDED